MTPPQPPSAATSSSPSTLNALNKLRTLTGKPWSHLEQAAKAANECRARVKDIVESENLISPDTAMVVFGSLARDEFTQGSDCDWTLLVDGMTIGDHYECAAKISKALAAAEIPGPGPTGVFGSLVHSHELVHQIGGDDDSNTNTTRRILLLLESAAIGEPSSALVRNRVISQIIKRYLEQEPSMTQAGGKRRVPRFLLNDVVRYWRTMAVDYARKVRDRNAEGWALRNIKLRLSRKLTFVSGMLTCFDCVLRPACSDLESDLFNDEQTQLLSVQEHVHAYVEATPIEILARAVYCYTQDEKSRKDLAIQLFDSYDAFLGMMGNPDQRKVLKTLALGDADSNAVFKDAKELGYEFQRGLTKLFFHTDKALIETTQEYGVFEMSRPMGFSTGALSKANYGLALSWIGHTDSDALELSALREDELPGLLGAIGGMDVARYRYKSIHAPKSFHRLTEAEAVRMLLPFANQGFRVILHPDAIKDFDAWRALGSLLCIENMDTRKSTGRTAQELRGVFEKLPDARFCFDIGHARQVDPSMAVAFGLLFEFRDRLEEIHASEVDTSGHHWAMSRSCLEAFGVIASRIAVDVAVIIESQVPQSRVVHELDQTRDLFSRHV